MSNRLEDFMEEHRDAFDSELPPARVWKGIEQAPLRQPKGKLVQWFTRTRVAATLLVMANAAVLFFLLQRNTPASVEKHVAPVEQTAGDQHSYEQELDQISQVVKVKQAGLKEIERTNPVLYKTFVQALDQLSTAYQDLEKELSTNPNKEALLEAMIQNLSLQQELLNQQLSIYQKIKQNSHEKNNRNI
jgi:hypothetical protein